MVISIFIYFRLHTLQERLSQGCGDNALMNKVQTAAMCTDLSIFTYIVLLLCLQYFSVLMAFLQVRQSTVLQSHVFAALRTFTHKVYKPSFSHTHSVPFSH